MPMGQSVMYREPNDKRWYPATVIQQLPEKSSYLIKTNDNVVYRKMQAHLKPYTPEKKIKPPELYTTDNNKVSIIVKVLTMTKVLIIIKV